jgi:hypothetical protein
MKSVVLAAASLSLLLDQAGVSRSDLVAAPHAEGEAVVTSLGPLPAGTWEARSKGAVVMGDVTFGPARILFARAGAAAIISRDGYVSLRWETPKDPGIPVCVGGEVPQTAQLAVQEQEGRRVLEIAFFRGTAKPAADRDTDAMLCQVQYWAEAGGLE